MDKKLVFALVAIIAVIALVIYIVQRRPTTPTVQAAVSTQTVTLSSSNPNQTVYLTIQCGTSVSLSLSMQGGQPYGVYTVYTNYGTYTLNADANGNGTLNIQTPQLPSSVNYAVTISGPGIPGSGYVLNLIITTQPSTCSVSVPTPTPTTPPSGQQIWTFIWNQPVAGIVWWSSSPPPVNSGGNFELPPEWGAKLFSQMTEEWQVTVPNGAYVYVIVYYYIPTPGQEGPTNFSFQFYVNGNPVTVTSVGNQLSCGKVAQVQTSAGLTLNALTCCSFGNTSPGSTQIQLTGACTCTGFWCMNCPGDVTYWGFGFMTQT